MGGARTSIPLLRSLVRNSDGGGGGGGGVFSSFTSRIAGVESFDFIRRIAATEECRPHLWSSRSLASDSEKGSSSSDKPSPGDEQKDKKSELGRWWQTFSEQSNTQQAGNTRKTKSEGNQRHTPDREQLNERSSLSREGGGSGWVIPEIKNQSGQEQESLSKETISRWFLPKDAEGSKNEQEREEITSKQVSARWLASSREKSSSEQELSDLSSISWFGLSEETPAAERERLEVSMQRLALMSKLGSDSKEPNFMFLPPKDLLLRKYFAWGNLSSPEKHKVISTKVRQDFQIHKTDCGSSQVQIALLTTRIKYMTKHMETHRKDYHSRKGLEGMVQRRRKILKYLRRKDWDSYCDVISKLGLRDNVMEPPKR